MGTDFSMIEGTGSSGVMIVAEASGEMEARDQLPLRPYAPSGSVLERVLRRMGLDRRMFSITNCVRCRPRNNWLENSPHEYAALNHCRPNLDAAIAQFKPRCIVALGGIALRELTGEAGEARGIGHLAGYVLPLAKQVTKKTVRDGYCPDCKEKGAPTPNCFLCDGLGYFQKEVVDSTAAAIPVIGNFHPSYLRRGKASHQGIFARILQRAVNIAAGRDREWVWGVDPDERSTYGTLRYQVHPSLDEARAFAARVEGDRGLVVSYDLETSESTSLDEDAREGFVDTQIRLIQFATEQGGGIAIPWEGDFRGIARQILQSPNVKCGHNIWLFDNKVLRAVSEREGVDYVPHGTLHDTLQMFHHWQPDLPAHLQFCAQFVQFPFPWKHLAGTDIEFYGCCDVDATLRLYNMLRGKLEADGIWGDETIGYLGQVAAVRPILAAMEDRGVPIDDAARLRLGAEFDAEQKRVGAELQAVAPEACKRVHPKEGYASLPPEVQKYWKEQGRAFNKGGKDHATIMAIEIPPIKFQEPSTKDSDGNVEEGEYYTYQRRKFPVASISDEGQPMIGVSEERWCRLYDFNPNSSKQLIAYMKAKGHPIPKSKEEDDEGNQKDTTGKKELVRLVHKTGDTFYLKVIEYREYSKMKGTYIEGFKPGADNRVHTTFTFDTGTGQLSSRNPNTQNYPTHHRLADAVGRMIAAPEGMILTKWDYRAFHVLTTGFEFECAEWMRMARLDMHSLVAGEFLKIWKAADLMSESDEELKARFDWFKSDPKRKFVRDKQAKPADLGIGFGEGPRRVFQENMEHFKSEKEAKDFHAILQHLFKPVFDGQEKVKHKAHQEQKLISRFGHIRRFYEVFRWDSKKNGWSHGDQAEEAVAFLPANHAHGHMREMKKEMAAARLDGKYGMCNEVHDAWWFCFPERLLEEHLHEIAEVLRRPSKILSHPTLAPYGLWCDVEASAGPNLTDMEKMNIGNAGTGVLPMGMAVGVS